LAELIDQQAAAETIGATGLDETLEAIRSEMGKFAATHVTVLRLKFPILSTKMDFTQKKLRALKISASLQKKAKRATPMRLSSKNSRRLARSLRVED